MEDYIVIVSTISLASLILALLWILRRTEQQHAELREPEHKEYDQAESEEETEAGDNEVNSETIASENQQNNDGSYVAEEQSPSISDGPAGNNIESHVESGDNGLDLDNILSELDAELERHSNVGTDGEELVPLSVNTTGEPLSDEAAGLLTPTDSNNNDLEESGIFDVDDLSESMTASGRLNSPDLDSIPESRDTLFSDPENSTRSGSPDINDDLLLNLEINSEQPIVVEPTTVCHEQSQPQTVLPDESDKAESRGQPPDEQVIGQTTEVIPASSSFLPDLIPAAIEQNSFHQVEPLIRPISSPVETQVTVQSRECELSNNATQMTDSSSDKSPPHPQYTTEDQLNEITEVTLDNSEISKGDQVIDSDLSDGSKDEGEFTCDDEYMVYDFPVDDGGIDELVKGVDLDKYRQVFSCAVEVYSRETTPEIESLATETIRGTAVDADADVVTKELEVSMDDVQDVDVDNHHDVVTAVAINTKANDEDLPVENEATEDNIAEKRKIGPEITRDVSMDITSDVDDVNDDVEPSSPNMNQGNAPENKRNIDDEPSNVIVNDEKDPFTEEPVINDVIIGNRQVPPETPTTEGTISVNDEIYDPKDSADHRPMPEIMEQPNDANTENFEKYAEELSSMIMTENMETVRAAQPSSAGQEFPIEVPEPGPTAATPKEIPEQLAIDSSVEEQVAPSIGENDKNAEEQVDVSEISLSTDLVRDAEQSASDNAPCRDETIESLETVESPIISENDVPVEIHPSIIHNKPSDHVIMNGPVEERIVSSIDSSGKSEEQVEVSEISISPDIVRDKTSSPDDGEAEDESNSQNEDVKIIDVSPGQSDDNQDTDDFETRQRAIDLIQKYADELSTEIMDENLGSFTPTEQEQVTEEHREPLLANTTRDNEEGGIIPAEPSQEETERVAFIKDLIWQSFELPEEPPSREDNPGLYEILDGEVNDAKYSVVVPLANLDNKPEITDDSQEELMPEPGPKMNTIKLVAPSVDQAFDRTSDTSPCNSPYLGRVDKILSLQHPASPDETAQIRFISEFTLPNVNSDKPDDQSERKIEEEVKDEDSKSNILAKQRTFNENCCMRCFSRFFFIFNQKVQCYGCKFYVCKNCSDYEKEQKEYICHVCQKQSLSYLDLETPGLELRELQEQSCDWFYSNVKKKFKRFGSAKVVRSLYKRKTESDSENDSGYHPSLYNTEPIGKRSRQSLGGLFDIDINGDPTQRELHATESTPGGKLRNDDSDTSLIEEEIIAERRERKYSIPYSCAVATGDSFSHVYDVELKDFKKQLEGIITDIHRTLEVQSPDIVSQDDNNGENIEKTVTNHKLHLSSALTNLAQSLHIAVDNQDLQTGSTKPVSATAKHQLVKQTLVKEVEQFTGHPIDIGEEPTSEYASEDGSQTSDSHSQRPYEDILADFMLKRIVEDFQKAQDENDRREEAALERSLKRLENRASVTLLNDMLSGVSESETDDPMSSAHSRLDDTASDAESKVSEFSELSLTTKDAGDSPLTNMSSPGLHNGFGETGRGLDINENKTMSDRVDNLTDEERNRRVDEHGLWDTVESRMSPLVSTAPQFSRKSYGPTDPDFTGDAFVHSTPAKDFSSSRGERGVLIPGGVRGEEMNDSDNTLEGSPQEESMIAQVASKAGTSPASMDEDSMMDYTQNRRIPLPSFDDDSVVGLPELDLDDISRRGDDEDEEPRSSNWESEITFSSQWKFDTGGLFYDHSISAYDNCGDKKVGLDGEGPVIMLVPNTEEEEGIRVGDRDIDQLSELSENDARSDISLDASDDDDLAEEAAKVTREISTMTDTAIQTAAAEESQVAAAAVVESTQKTPEHDAEALRAAKATALAAELPPVSSEGVETDPKFVQRPGNITVVEGEPMKLECQVTGSDPIDVFWYKDTAEVAPLEDDERSDVQMTDNKHSAEVFNTTKADGGQYLCIGVNDKGQCNQSFKVTVKENTNEKSAPEFIKELQSIEAVVGQSVKLRCKVTGYPVPRVLWYRDGKRIKNSDQYRIEKYGNRDYVLWLEYASISDDAEYMVVARNMAGEAKCKAQLIVEATEGALQERTDRLERPLSPVTPDSTRVPDTLYPDTSELLRLAEQVSATRGTVQDTSQKTASSARQFNSLNQQLDDMDRRLETLQDEVVDTMNNNSGSNWNAPRQTNEDLQSSAYAVREVTNSALGVLAEAEIARGSPPGGSSTTHLVLTRDEGAKVEEQVEINLSYAEFEKLYAAGKITREQMKTGKINRRDKKMIEDYLRQEAQFGRQNDLGRGASHDLRVEDEDLKVFDCGLKRVDSKRYNRDYVVVRDGSKASPQVQRRKSWAVNTGASSQAAAEVVRSTPAGQRENVHAEIAAAEEQDLTDIQEQEEHQLDNYSNKDDGPSDKETEIYMAAGKVYELEAQVRELQNQVDSVDEDASPWELSQLESQVASAVAKVASNDEEVTEIEKSLEQTFQEAPNMPSEWKQALKFSRRHSEKLDSAPELSQYEDRRQPDRRQSMPVVYNAPVATTRPASRPAAHPVRNIPPVAEQRQERMQQLNIQTAEPVDEVSNENLSPVSPITPVESAPVARRPEPVQLSGETEEDAVPESRAEYEEDISLPSVKNLMSKFNTPEKAESSDASVKRYPQSYSRRVYSLTGRDIPRTIREKLKKQGPTIVPNSNVRSKEPQYETQRRPIGSIFEDPSAQVEQQHAGGVHSAYSSTDEIYPYAVTEQMVSSAQELSGGGVTRSQSFESRPVRRSQSFDAQSERPAQIKPRSKEESSRRESLGAPKKGKNSTIMARAAFWDTRINHGSITDELELEFPDMPEDSFKSY